VIHNFCFLKVVLLCLRLFGIRHYIVCVGFVFQLHSGLPHTGILFKGSFKHLSCIQRVNKNYTGKCLAKGWVTGYLNLIVNGKFIVNKRNYKNIYRMLHKTNNVFDCCKYLAEYFLVNSF